MFAAPDCPWTPAEQAEIWRRTANVFWPQARGAACRDAEVRAACAPGLTACKALWKLGDENTRPDWKLFAFLLNHFGPRFAPLGGRAAETEIKLCTHCRGAASPMPHEPLP